MMRALNLYGLWALSLAHRLRHELGRELTVLLAGGVMFATFFHIFNDFLNVQVAAIALSMRASFASVLTIVAMALVTAAAARTVRGSTEDRVSVASLAVQLGEDKRVQRAYQLLRAGTIIALWHGALWYAVERWLNPWTLSGALATEAVLLLATVALVRLPLPSRDRHTLSRKADVVPKKAESRALTLTHWRLRQILQRGRLTKLCLLLAAAFGLLVPLAAERGAPVFVPTAAALLAGYLVAATLCVQLGEDLRCAWLERGVGVSHDEFLRSYTYAGVLLGGGAGLVAGLVFLGGSLACDSPSLPLAAAAKVAAVTAVPCLVAPPLLMQIDGRRLPVTLLLTLIAALFIGTAVFVHWAAVALIPLLAVTAGPAQAGRFYRA